MANLDKKEFEALKVDLDLLIDSSWKTYIARKKSLIKKALGKDRLQLTDVEHAQVDRLAAIARKPYDAAQRVNDLMYRLLGENHGTLSNRANRSQDSQGSPAPQSIPAAT